MTRFASRQSLGKKSPCLSDQLRRKLLHRLELGLQHEPEILELPFERERSVLPSRIIQQLGLATRGVSLDEIHGDLRPLDRRARNSGAVGEIAEIAGDCSPASTHACLGNPRFGSVGRLLIDYEIEGHESRKQISEPSVD